MKSSGGCRHERWMQEYQWSAIISVKWDVVSLRCDPRPSSLDALRRFHGELFSIPDTVSSVLFRCVRAHRTPDADECTCCSIRCSVSVQNTLLKLSHTVPCGVERCSNLS
jgi:hypothetical protein